MTSLFNFNAIDLQISKRLKIKRTELNLSQPYLANYLQVTVQQYYRYEKGVNRILAGKLFVLAALFNVLPTYFFDGKLETISKNIKNDFTSITNENERINLINAFFRIKNLKLRKHILQLCALLSRQN